MKQYLAQASGPGAGSSSAFFARAFGLQHNKASLARSASFSSMSDSSFLAPGGLLSPSTDGTFTAPHKTQVSRFSCRSLAIGSWRRVGCSAMDLVVFYSPSQMRLMYYINNDSIGFKIEYPFSAIQQIFVQSRADSGSDTSGSLDNNNIMGDLVVILNQPPQFWMESSDMSGGWFETDDFTEDRQATRVLEHRLTGPLKELEQQLTELLSLHTETLTSALPNGAATRANRSSSVSSVSSNANLSSTTRMMNALSFTTSAPVSPLVAGSDAFRSMMPPMPPASQRVDGGVNNFSGFTPQYMPGTLASGSKPSHRRTRSRSVPAVIDFSYMNPVVNPGFAYHGTTDLAAAAAAAGMAPIASHPTPPPMTQMLSEPLQMLHEPSHMSMAMDVVPAPSPSPHVNPPLRIDPHSQPPSTPFMDPYSYALMSAGGGADGAAVPPDTSYSGLATPISAVEDLGPGMNPYWVPSSAATDGVGVSVYADDMVMAPDDVVAGTPMQESTDMFENTFVKPDFVTNGTSAGDELLDIGLLGINGSV